MVSVVLVIALIVCAVALAVVLILRISRERRVREALALLSPARVSGMIEASLRTDGLTSLTGHISQVLTESLDCQRLVFLRQTDNYLEYEYGFGVAATRQTWRTACPVDLEDQLGRLGQTSSLASVADLRGLLPDSLLEALNDSACDLYFPICWGSQLYGLYFLASSDSVRLPVLRLVVASIGQSMSAAYHLEWYRSQHQKLQRRVSELQNDASAGTAEAISTSRGLLKLVRHHDSETLVGRIVEEISREVGLDRYSFFIPPGRNHASVRVLEHGVSLPAVVPRAEQVERVLTMLGSNQMAEVATLTSDDTSLATFQDGLQQAGLKYLAAFPLLDEQVGILAWDGRQPAQEVMTQLRQHHSSVSELMANAASFEEVLGLSYTDGLTGLANHRFFVRRLDEEIDRARRYGRSLALIIFDLDELKLVNDGYGHLAGDSVLRQMGEVLRASVRSNDVVARYGGDEFCIVMPESDRATCRRFVRRFQKKIAGTGFKIDSEGKELTCTVSQGGAIFPDNGTDSEQLIYAADMALLEAKNSGRNGYKLA